MSSMSSGLAVATPAADDLSRALAAERPRLTRLCRQMTQNADAAEDLTQETLLEAWRLRDRLRDPAGLSAWLAAIARNICLRWLRAQGRERAHLALASWPESADESAAVPPDERFPDEADDPLAEMERAEVAALLERALATLPATTRALTLASAELSTAELACSFQLSEGAVRVRLHRGRLAVRQALSGVLRPEAEALDLALPAAPIWSESRIWCPFCGVGHLRYRVDRATGEFAFHCTGPCEWMAVAGCAENEPLLRQVSSPKSLVTRHCLSLATSYREALAGAPQRCDCGALVSFSARFPEDVDSDTSYGLIGVCSNCGPVDRSSAWHLALDTVEAQRFWRRYPRMRALPITLVERDNRPALVTGFAAFDGAARLEIVSDAHTYALLHVTTMGG
ncbi:MAG TPA: RNA polymerase sigma factor [Ktedonobacterales bacterium]|nr:RNA polymerase sigma factor [Ktedonobacterales bacterium]